MPAFNYNKNSNNKPKMSRRIRVNNVRNAKSFYRIKTRSDTKIETPTNKNKRSFSFDTTIEAPPPRWTNEKHDRFVIVDHPENHNIYGQIRRRSMMAKELVLSEFKNKLLMDEEFCSSPRVEELCQ